MHACMRIVRVPSGNIIFEADNVYQDREYEHSRRYICLEISSVGPEHEYEVGIE